jgi:ERCC4-type nuclease
MVRLIIDVHEGEFLATISKADERKALSVGDFLLDTGAKETSWILERKTWGDGLNSWKSKRLQDQIARMVEEYDNYAVVVEGRPEDFYASQEHDWKSFRSFLNRVSLETCPVIYTDTVSETTQFVHSLKKRIEDGTAHHFVRPITIVKSSRNEHHNLLQSIPGIGREKAKKLYELYGNLSDVFSDWERAKDNKVVVAKTWEKVNTFFTEEWITKEPETIRQREQTQSKLW